MIQEEECRTSKLLRELGGDVRRLRKQFEREAECAQPAVATGSDLSRRLRSSITETGQIHGLWWNADYIHDGVKRCRRHNWHWHKASWKSRDAVVNRRTGRISLDLSLAEDSANFEVVKDGWKKDRCAICSWELFESEDLHGTGYTNGREWVCMECYEKLWQRPDFISSSYSDIT